MTPDGPEDPDWIAFDEAAAQIKEVIMRLPESEMKGNALTRWAEMCYWFNEAHIEAHDPGRNQE